MKEPQIAASVLSARCVQVFEGKPEMKTPARALDFLAHGQEIASRADAISAAVIRFVGDRSPGDMGQSGIPESVENLDEDTPIRSVVSPHGSGR